jgi:hypothetical protein
MARASVSQPMLVTNNGEGKKRYMILECSPDDDDEKEDGADDEDPSSWDFDLLE